MKAFPLKNNQGTILVDDQDTRLVESSTWYFSRRGLSAYAVRHVRVATNKYKGEYLHRVIMHPPKGMEVDHINGNGLDNRRCNLRIVTKRGNACNRTHITKKSKYVGVSWRPRDKLWRATMRYHGKRVYLTESKNEIDAATAYRVAYAVLIEGR